MVWCIVSAKSHSIYGGRSGIDARLSCKRVCDRVEGEAEVDMVKWVDWLCTQMRRLSKSLQEREASGWRINLIMGDDLHEFVQPSCMEIKLGSLTAMGWEV